MATRPFVVVRVAHRIFQGPEPPVSEVAVEARKGSVAPEMNILLTEAMTPDVYRAVKSELDRFYPLIGSHNGRCLLLFLASMLLPMLLYGIVDGILNGALHWDSAAIWILLLVCFGLMAIFMFVAAKLNLRSADKFVLRWVEILRDINESYASGGALWHLELAANRPEDSSVFTRAIKGAHVALCFKLNTVTNHDHHKLN